MGEVTLEFQILDLKPRDCDTTHSFVFDIYGVDETGATVKVTTPFLQYVVCDLPKEWTTVQVKLLYSFICSKIGKMHSASVAEGFIIHRRKLYGFDDGEKHKFACFRVSTNAAFRKVVNLWYGEKRTKEGRRWGVNPEGLVFEKKSLKLFQAHIPASYWFIQQLKLNTTGWVRVTGKPSKDKVSRCAYEFHVENAAIQPLPDKTTTAPLVVASVDIECSSRRAPSFPKAVEDYTRTANELLTKVTKSPGKPLEQVLREELLGIFGFRGYEERDTVLPKVTLTEEAMEALIAQWFAHKIKALVAPSLNKRNARRKPSLDDSDDEEEDIDRANLAAVRGKTVLAVLQNRDSTHEVKMVALVQSLDEIFPELHGDYITIVGITLKRFGESDPFKKVCIVLGKCAPMEGVELHCCPDERTVLLKTTEVMVREQPHVITGYNALVFDLSYMFDRARETGCLREFLQMTWEKTSLSAILTPEGDYVLHETEMTLASGTYTLRYLDFTGIFIDPCIVFRREVQLDKYGLDDVSAHYICGDVTGFVRNRDTNTVRLSCTNAHLVRANFYVVLKKITYYTDLLSNGHKFEVIAVGDDYIEIRTGLVKVHEELQRILEEKPTNAALKTSVEWGLVKNDISPMEIFQMAKEGPEALREVCRYCLQDTVLNGMLIDSLLTKFFEMGNVCKVPLNDLLYKGQGVRTKSVMASFCMDNGIMMDVLPSKDFNDGYEGAVVLNQISGDYLNSPILVLDFQSLYPSIIQAYDLSHTQKVSSTFTDLEGNVTVESSVRSPGLDALPDYQYEAITFPTFRTGPTASGKMERQVNGEKRVVWAKYVPPPGQSVPKEKKGVVSAVLEIFLEARKKTRKFMKTVKVRQEYERLEQRQLAYKVGANSFYGVMGAEHGAFSDIDLAASCTAMGRKTILLTKEIIETVYQNMEWDGGLWIEKSVVVYGDTDSVFLEFYVYKDGVRLLGDALIPVAAQIGIEAAKLVTGVLPDYLNLECGELLRGLLLARKKYVAISYNPDELAEGGGKMVKGKAKCMGVAMKRRGIMKFLKYIYQTVFDMFFNGESIDSIVKYLWKMLDDIMEGKVPINQFVLTRMLREIYKKPEQIAHRELADRMALRDPGNPPRPGDRIEFVFANIPGMQRNAKQGKRIETPEFMASKGYQPDYQYYIEHQIMTALGQVFGIFLEKLPSFSLAKYQGQTAVVVRKHAADPVKRDEAIQKVRQNYAEELLFGRYMRNQKLTMTSFFQVQAK
jgi:DNA polymerase elongation subunit (family B)